ncbi:MAG: nitrilase-related carbon-nitrogen hydrolase, partial [Nitrospiraceae bacterium]
MRVGFFQFNPAFGEVKRNLDLVIARLEQVQCDLMVLPELFASGYQFVSKEEVGTLAEPVPDGDTTRRLSVLAKDRRMHIVAGLPERSAAGCYNSAVLVGPTGFIGC